MRVTMLFVPALVALVVAGCGGSSSASGGGGSNTVNPNAGEVSPAGDIPDNQAFVRFAPPGAGFSVKVPEGWARTASGGAVTFTDKLNSVHLGSAPAGSAATKSRGTVTTVHRPAGDAVRMTYAVRSAPDAVTGKVVTDAVERYVFTHNGRAAIVTLSGPKGADNVDPWRIVTDSLRWTR